mmetsp:Transcript_14982/g.20953  ORF Transcript_14982/g.20953 Transcript_14982/m.20953 type:complete len:640 (+) Transcript_14982:107-2026(+)
MSSLLGRKFLRRLAISSGILGTGILAYVGNATIQEYFNQTLRQQYAAANQNATVPSREEQVSKLKSNNHDILVIGGGASGSGVALDAATRGLRVALVERDDFSAGTSSRSTKLIHGGVRYLEKAVTGLDGAALSLVFEALQERSTFLQVAPHLTNPIPIMTPCYKWWEVPYYYVGLKMYDLLAGTQNLQWSRFYDKTESIRQFPVLQPNSLKGTVVYYDGQMNDSRMNVSIALTAAAHGAAVANHLEVVHLLKDSNDKVCGAHVKDNLSGSEFDIRAKVVVNAAGPFVDHIRKMENPAASDIIVPSSGVHVILPDYYSPEHTGLIIPKTKDGRVLFMLPWQGATIAGTTDSSTKLTYFPHPHENEINFILESLSEYLQVNVRREDVRAAWSGIRPLARDPKATDTASISRDHVLFVSDGGLVTIAGGKWTTYRSMAQDTVNKAIEVGQLKPTKGCQTKSVLLLGAENWSPSYFTQLLQDYKRLKTSKTNHSTSLVSIPTETAKHWAHSYGTRAKKIAELAQNGYGNRLVVGHPYLEAEVVYAAKEEYAFTAVDVIARRMRLAFLDSEAAHKALPRVVELMAKVHNWDSKRAEAEMAAAKYFLHIMNSTGRGDKYNDDEAPPSLYATQPDKEANASTTTS